MIYINITSFVLISYLEKDDSMTETRSFKNVIFSKQLFFRTSFVLSRKIIKLTLHFVKPLQTTMYTFSPLQTNFQFYETKLRIMTLTFHILKRSSYRNINI